MIKQMAQLDYLLEYSKLQQEILLVKMAHPDDWKCRTLFGSKDYIPTAAYEHRSTLDNEIVIEFDSEDPKFNHDKAMMVVERLKLLNYSYFSMFTGNKSTHVHTFIDIRDAKDVTLLKRLFLKYITDGIAKPDMQMAVRGHMVRAECSINEKTGTPVKLLHESVNYPEPKPIPQHIWDEYRQIKEARINRAVLNRTDLEQHPGIQLLLNTITLKTHNDGRERALFLLIHVLKHKFKEARELGEFLWDWYRYTGGRKLSRITVFNKVKYHWNRDYTFSPRKIAEIIEDIGLEEE